MAPSGQCGLRVSVCSLACEGELSACAQPPVTQSCSESALVGLGAPKAPTPTCPQAMVLAVAAPRKVDQKGMFVAGGPGWGGGRLGAQNIRDHSQVSLGGHLPPSGAGWVWPSPQLGASGTKSRGHTRVCLMAHHLLACFLPTPSRRISLFPKTSLCAGHPAKHRV